METSSLKFIQIIVKVGTRKISVLSMTNYCVILICTLEYIYIYTGLEMIFFQTCMKQVKKVFVEDLK